MLLPTLPAEELAAPDVAPGEVLAEFSDRLDHAALHTAAGLLSQHLDGLYRGSGLDRRIVGASRAGLGRGENVAAVAVPAMAVAAIGAGHLAGQEVSRDEEIDGPSTSVPVTHPSWTSPGISNARGQGISPAICSSWIRGRSSGCA